MQHTRRYIYTALIFVTLLGSFLTFVNMSSGKSEFDEVCYLARYPAVAEKWVSDDRTAFSHWKAYGQFEDRIPGCNDTSAKSTRADARPSLQETNISR